MVVENLDKSVASRFIVEKVSFSKKSCHSLHTVASRDAAGKPRSLVVSSSPYRGMIHYRIKRRISGGIDLQEDAIVGDAVQLDFSLDGGITSIGVMMEKLNGVSIAMERSNVEG